MDPTSQPSMASDSISVPQGEQAPAWTALVAGKKVAWALGLFTTSVGTAPALAPAAVATVQKISGILQPWGVTLVVDQSVFAKALPFLMFAALVAGHDYAKVKTKIGWL